MNIDFSNFIVLITGGTRGIGKALVEAFESSGASLIITGRNHERVDKLNIKYKNKRREYFAVDFSDLANYEQFEKYILEKDKIDVLVNNAGINIVDNFIESKNTDFTRIVNVNINAPYRLSKLVAKKMIKHRYGRIINICSIWSIITREKRALYTMSKNALHGLTQTMSVELAPYNILVNSVSPGFTLTDLTRKTNTEEELKNISMKIPMKRMAVPAEIANTVLFLASNKNTYLTGQNIVVDGGYTNV